VDITARRAAEEALARSESRLAEAQRVAHVGSWEWEVAGNRVTWSEELYRIYGLDQGQFDGSYEAFLARVHPDDLDHTRQVVIEALRSPAPFVYDHRIVRADKEVRMLHTRGEVLTGAQGKPVRLVGCCWDVSERWLATTKREQSISLLRATLEASADGLLVVDGAGQVTALNQRLRELWRLPPAVTEGTSIGDILLVVNEQLQQPEDFLRKVGELYAQRERESLDVLRFADGRVYERLSRPQRVGQEIVGRVCSFRDVTQREQAQERLQASADQLRALAARLDAVREEERRLMAREIHDQLGQALTALKLDLASLRVRLPAGDSELGRRAEDMDRLLDDTLETARRLSSSLRPPILDDLGVIAAIKWQAADFESRTGVRCLTELPEAELVDAPGGLVLFRIVQEALTNVARHAGAHQVRIRIAADPTALVLTITDDGRGITPEEQARPSSLGLLGMRERALLLGGEVTIDGAPGAGTRVTVRVPRSRPD
jgi:PAS domain S-box-containing protein